jgi:hypothetical protein
MQNTIETLKGSLKMMRRTNPKPIILRKTLSSITVDE